MANTETVLEAGPTKTISPGGHLLADRTFNIEALQNAGNIVSSDTDLGEVLATVNVIDEGDAESWYTAWKATADLVLALANRTPGLLSKGRADMRVSTRRRTVEVQLSPDDPERAESLERK